jgi:hypothetical protein
MPQAAKVAALKIYSFRPPLATDRQPNTHHANSHASNTMVVRIRLARFGKRHRPYYNIVVAHARCAPLPFTLRIGC